MPFEWLVYVDLADKLVLGDSEEYYRAAISRAYYGVFCKIRQGLERKGIIYSSQNIHSKIIRHIRRNIDQGVADDLDSLRRSRILADYNDLVAIDKLNSEASLYICHQIIESGRHIGLIEK